MPESINLERDIFLAALDCADATERATYVEKACNGDATLLKRIDALLHSHDSAHGFLSNAGTGSPGDPDPRNEPAAPTEGPGSRIGRYKILEAIGEGGFGVVYMAEQEEPVRRRVALKVIKLGMDTREVVARFEAERQALAMMTHRSIASVFDGGATASGRPYFVMELVRGIPITEFCNKHRLTVRKRLELFTQVCNAIQHAHQKGVIHRDLKPSNILIAGDTDDPVPKVIDFGIAKAIDQRLTEKTLFTRFHKVVGTPAYMSPEQTGSYNGDIDTRSDIYSLGVLLYQLLTGRTPFDSKTHIDAGYAAIERTIRETEPPRPSARIGTLSADEGTTVARDRGTDPARLRSRLRGDLDWIVMRCIEKDRTRRYETAATLMADVRHHLRNEPVAARPPSTTYTIQKFIRRHKVGFFAATSVATALIAGLIVSAVLLVREQRAHARAVAAEQSAIELKHQAEVARADEEKRAARTSLELADQNLSDGRVADGLAHLVYAARKDPMNPILAPRLASVLASHNFILPESAPFECGSRVIAIRYSLDGRTFMAGTEDGAMRVFDSATGQVVREFRVGRTVCWVTGSMLARANDGIFGARFQDNALKVFDAATGRQLGGSIQLDPSVGPDPNTLAFSPDGRWILAYATGAAKFWLWDAVTGEERLVHAIEGGYPQDFDFSADGRRLCFAGGDELLLLSLPDCVPIVAPIKVERAPGRKNRSLFARFSPDGRQIVVIDPSVGIHVFDSATGASLGSPVDTQGSAFAKAWEFSPDGRLLCVGDKTSEIRDLSTGRITSLPFSSRDGFGQDKSFSRDGSLLLVTETKEALASVWDTRTGTKIAECSLQLPANIRGALSPDGTHMVIGTADGSIHRLRIGRGSARPLVLARPQPLLPLAFQPEAPARLLWLTADRARVLDVASGREVSNGFPFPRKITEAAPGDFNKSPLRPDLKFLVVRAGKGWESWELSTSAVTKVVPLQGDPPPNGIVTFNPAGDLVAINDQASIRVWDLRTGACVGPPIDPGWPLSAPSVNFSPDGRRLAAAFVMGAPVIWEVATSQPAKGTFEAQPERTFASVQFSPDGRKVVTADFKGDARLWDTASGKPLSPVVRAADLLYRVSFSPDGLYFVGRSSAEVRIWDTSTAALVGKPISLLGSAAFLRFSPDGRRFTTESRDGRMHVFDLRTAQAVAEPMSHGAMRTSAGEFSPDGRFVRTETGANEFCIWSVPPALPDGTPPPEWLLQLGTACAGKIVNDEGQLSDVTDTEAMIAKLRAELDAKSPNDPLADWGRWVLNDRPDRSIAPGFTITPAEADELNARLSAAAP